MGIVGIIETKENLETIYNILYTRPDFAAPLTVSIYFSYH